MTPGPRPVRIAIDVVAGAVLAASASLLLACHYHFAWGGHLSLASKLERWAARGCPGWSDRLPAAVAIGVALGLAHALLAAEARDPHAIVARRALAFVRAGSIGALGSVLLIALLHRPANEARHHWAVLFNATLFGGGVALLASSLASAWRRACRPAPNDEPQPGPGPLDVAWCALFSGGLTALLFVSLLVAAWLSGADPIPIRPVLRVLAPLGWGNDWTALLALLGTLWLGIWCALLARATTTPRRTRLRPGEVALAGTIALVAGPVWAAAGLLVLYS